ncbi:MAG: hypothetical protein QOI89_2919 [Solirubrobacteraceae bacterium]|nr:hypothetical protein [Solirubrobacteraceae bacterium]
MSTRPPRFDLQARERLLALLTVGVSMEEAAAAAGTSRQTVARWAARGRVEGAPAEYVSFAKRLDAIGGAQAEDVAERPDVPGDPPEHPYRSQVWGWVQAGDVFTAISPRELAELTEEQAAEAQAPHSVDAEPWQRRVLDGCAKEAAKLRRAKRKGRVRAGGQR